MPQILSSPIRLHAHGSPPKSIEEYIGQLNSKTEEISIARMISPSGWNEPGQTPEFDEYTLVLRGELRIESTSGIATVSAGQAVITHRGEWVRYSTPGPEGAEYIAVCTPAFSPTLVRRDQA